MRGRTFLWLTLVCVLILATVQYGGYGGLGIVFALACAAAAGVLWALLGAGLGAVGDMLLSRRHRREP